MQASTGTSLTSDSDDLALTNFNQEIKCRNQSLRISTNYFSQPLFKATEQTLISKGDDELVLKDWHIYCKRHMS
ncbi:hypothetical protein Gotri_020176, partial [Gossypium trilobum]|nr:hypothetical protein [Gossypium trilobum]